jgi:hypothetical protein
MTNAAHAKNIAIDLPITLQPFEISECRASLQRKHTAAVYAPAMAQSITRHVESSVKARSKMCSAAELQRQLFPSSKKPPVSNRRLRNSDP